ncbi:MAG: NAD(P)-dependent oxidoreductase [Candidatus Tectomicrobia bacterium]|uniref:NAD(P)-dependent oxidoreductase n=1 Tax=Tectimicrobiota bacterium TaxID=2528274 RepID=A0A932HZW2_UNCTE|nr:NAD(P)-dependent oxidoreductase [Candidatus Tectomicrobia bacterium]
METFAPGRTTVGFVGIGKMGVPMSRNLRRGDFAVVAYDTRPEALETVRGDGVQPARDLAELAARAGVVITMLPDSAIVEKVVLGPGGLAEHLAPGKLIIDMSSSYPPRTRALAEALAQKGIQLIGAPVSGGVTGAEAATLAIMPGGPKAAVEAAMPIFKALGKSITHVSEAVESGHAMKCVNNFLSATNMLSSMEAMTLAQKLGLDARTALDVVNNSTGMNTGTRDKWPRFLLKRSFTTGFSMGLMHKDLSMASDLAKEAGTVLFLLNHVRQMYALGVSQYGFDADQAHLLEIIESWAGRGPGKE